MYRIKYYSMHSGNRRSYLSGILFAVFVSSGLLLSSCVAPPNDADRGGDIAYKEPAFKKAHHYYMRGNYEKAIDKFSDILLSSPGTYDSVLIADAYCLRAECHRRTNKSSLARFDYDQAIKVTEASLQPRGDAQRFVLDCRIAKGDTYMYEGAYIQADRLFKELLGTRLLTPDRDRLQFRRYICAVKMGSEDAEVLLEEIVNFKSFDEAKLRKEFLGGGTATHLYVKKKITPRKKRTTAPAPQKTTAVLPRSAWRAGPIGDNIDFMTPIFRITVHHTGDECYTMDYTASAAQMLTYQNRHQTVNGWADIGYHFIIDRAGRIWEGRELKYQGAHAGNSEKNRGNIGVCLFGDFETQEPTSMQKETLVDFLDKLCRIYKLDRNKDIYTHKELSATECPGMKLQQVVRDYRNIYR